MPLNESIYRRKQREEEERRRREQAVEIARGGSNNSATSPQTSGNYNSTNSSTSSRNSSQTSSKVSQGTPAEKALFKIAGRKFTDRLDRAVARDNGTGNTNKTRTLDRTNERTYSRYDTEGTEKSNIRKNFEKDRAEFRKEHPVGRWLGAEGNNALWGLDAELAKGVDFFLPDVITPKKVQQGLDYYKKQGEEAQKTVEKERGGSIERTIAGTVGGESLKNIPSATMAYLSGGASVGAQVAGKAVPSLYKASELTHVGNTFTRALNEVAKTTGNNPMFWETFARTIGTTYENEIENGADPVRATMSAYTNALLNAQIEVGGGIEVYDPSEDFLKAVARSAKEEGLEEVEQYAVENLVNKAVGSNTARWLSLTRGQDAVINPVDMAEQGFYGALSGGLMSGGRTALANARTEAIDSALNPVSAEAVQQGMADQRGLVNRGLVQERADEDGEQISTKAKSLAQDLQAQLDRGEALQPNQVKRLIREINKESNANEQSLERARVREVGKSLDEGSFVEETGLNLEQQISKQKDSALESRSRDKVKAILGENASDNEIASVTKVVIGTANSRDIDTVLTKPALKNAVADMVNEGADADSKIQIPISNTEARTVLENLTAVKGIANRNAILKETQEENAEDIKALLTNLNSGGKDLFANHLAEGSNAIGDVYQNRFYRMYNEGRKDGADFEDAYNRLITPLGSDVQAVFTRDFAQQIFAQGKASLATDNAMTTAKSLAEKYANRSSGVTYENNDDSIISEAEKKGLETLAKAGNVEIRVMKNLTATDKDGKALLTKDGKELMVNGMYKDGTIYISANTKNKLVTVAKHELTHYIKEMSPERYKELEDFVLKKWYKNDPVAMAKRIEEYQRLYKDATPEEAREELIADASEAFFTDEATIEEAVSFSKKLGKAIHDGIKHILDAFTGDTRGYRGYGDFMKDLGILQEAERMWLEALEDTQQRKKNARGNVTAEDYVDASTQYTTSDEKHSLVESDDEIERLNSEPTQKSYRAMALIDGKLYPPMATKVKDKNGKWVLQQGADIGQWLKSDITTDPKMFNSNGQFILKKDNDDTIPASYNPYIHSSDTMLNDQFATAYKRPNIVVVEGEIPTSELTNGKRAEHDLDDGRHIKAKDPTGTIQWKAGIVQGKLTGTRTVFLTNHFKPTRVVPDSEVARSIQDMVKGTDVAIPYNVVTPSLRQELQKLGVKMEQSKQKGYQVDLNAKFSVTAEEDQSYMDAVNRGDMETAQRMVDEQAKKNGYDIKAYHGTNAQFTRFDPDKLGSKNFMAGSAYLGFFASKSKETAESYTGLNSMDAMATVFSSQSKDYMEKIKRKYNYDERQAELDNQREQFFENYRRENRYYEEVEDPIKELKQQFEQNRQIFVRKDGSDYFDNFMKDFEDNHRTSLVYDWNKKHLNDMYRAWEETQAYKDNQELEQEIYKEWEKYEIKRRGYVPHVLDLYLKMERPFVHDFKGEGRDTESFASRMAQAKEEGYDGCIFKNVADGADIDDIYTVFSNTQLKSADPVTYDDNGNVIPLSERFNESNEDIRWSVTTEDEALPKGGKIPKSLEKWAKQVGLDSLSKQDSKVPVNVSVRSLRSYWYAMNGRTDEARTVNKSLRSVADALQKLSVKYKYIGLDDAMNATVHYRTDEKGRPTSVYLTCQVKNAEYEINYDFTTICAKRAPLQKVLERFIKTEGERMDTLYDELKLDEEGMYKLRLILEQAGFEVSCIACFVEQNRYSQQAQAETVATDWNKALDEWATENGTRATEHFDLANLDLKSIPFEEIKKGFTTYYRLMREWKNAHPKDSANVSVKNRMLIEAIPYFRKRMNPSEYASIDGQRALMAMGNKKTNLYNLLKRGQGYAKQSVPFVAYNGEVALLPDRVKNKSLFNYLMSIGGARAQSASDFQIEYVFDYMQMVADLSARRLPMHMYTKVIELAELFGKTGIKINLSAMCAVDNSVDSEYAGLKKVNGRWVYNISDQSIDYNKAVKLQRQEGYSKNIGIIMVTLSKYHMLKALGDKDVRYIIGYHSSKMPAVVSKASDMESAMDCTKINKTNRLNDKGRELFDRAMSIAKGDTELERYKNALRIFDDMIQREVSKEKADKRPRRGNEYSRYMTGFKANTADFDVYNDIKSTKDPRKTADNYIQYCMDNDLIPMYFPFAFHENYYKCEVYDFNMFDNNTGEYAPMEAVQNIYPDLDMTKGETDTTKFMGRVSKYMNEQNKKNKALEPKYQEVERRAKETLRIDIDGNDHMDMDAMEIDPNEYKHRADVLTDIRDGKASVSEVEDSEYGRLQKENETLKEAVWKRNEQISVERMRAEMDVQRERRKGTERKRKAVDETRERYEARINDLKEQQKERERKAKERREEAERKQKEHRKQVHERASARRRASEERARQERQEQREARREKKQDSEARTRLLNIARRLDKIKGTDEFEKIKQTLIGNLDLEAKSMTGKTKMKLEDLEKWYQDQVDNNDWFVKNEKIEEKFKRLKKTHIADMDIDDVRNLTEILLMLEHKMRNDKKLINSQYKKDVFMASLEASNGIKQSKGLKFFGLHKLDDVFVGQVLSPIRYIRRITGYDENNPLLIATRELQNGEIASLDYREKALKPFLKYGGFKFASYLNGRNAPEIEVNATTVDMKPTTVKIIPAIRIWFYLSSLNEDNMRHIVNGAVNIPDAKLLKAGKKSDAYDRGNMVRFSKSQVQAIIDGMTAEEKAYAKEVYRYFNEVAPKATNEVSEQLDGISIAKVKNYFRISVDKSFLDVEADAIKRDGTLENMGSHKERVKSSKPVYAEDVSDVLISAIEADAKYVGMAIPIRNFNKIYRSSSMEVARGQAEHIELTGTVNNSPSNMVLNDEQTATYRTRTGGYLSVQDTIRNMWSSDALKYIDDFLGDLQFPTSKVGAVERALRSLTSNYAGAVLTLNASVAIKQSASYPTAGAVLGWKPLIKAFGKMGKLDLEYANSVTPLLAYRAEGFNFREAGDIQNRSGRDSWFKRILRTPAFNWIQAMDLLTTRKLFKASEIYVQDKYHLKRGQSGYDEKVAEIFNRVITETQPNYTVMERAGHLRSDSTLERTLSMFKTQPYQNFNIWYDATGNYLAKRDAYKKSKTTANREALKEASTNLGNATTSQIAQLAVFAMMTSLWALARGKDDKWRDEEGNLSFASYLKQLAHDMVGGLASEFFLGSDIFSAVDSVISDSYYSGFSSVTDSSINDFFNTGMDMTKLLQQAWDYAVKGNEEDIDTDKLLKQMEKVVTEGGRFSGIPTGNLINLKNLMYRWVCVAKDGEYVGEYEALKASYGKDTYKKEILMKAYRNDTTAYKKLRTMMIEDGFKESSLDEYINKQKKDNKSASELHAYDSSIQTLETSPIWNSASEDNKEYYTGVLENISVGIENQSTEYVTKLAKNGLTNEQVILYKLALKKVDKPNKNGNLGGTPTNAEKEDAIRLLERYYHLTQAQKDTLMGK